MFVFALTNYLKMEALDFDWLRTCKNEVNFTQISSTALPAIKQFQNTSKTHTKCYIICIIKQFYKDYFTDQQ